MERAPDDRDALQAPAKSPTAANDPVIEDSGPAPGWDPAEIWRTRVKDARDQRPRDGQKTAA